MNQTLEQKQIQQRREALLQAKAHLRIEGLQPSEFAQPLLEQYVQGELSADQVRGALHKRYKVSK
jgi:Antitoxin VbhA